MLNGKDLAEDLTRTGSVYLYSASLASRVFNPPLCRLLSSPQMQQRHP
nr:MAG TPA: hypothetical protein [Caudoviricetes sp.]